MWHCSKLLENNIVPTTYRESEISQLSPFYGLCIVVFGMQPNIGL